MACPVCNSCDVDQTHETQVVTCILGTSGAYRAVIDTCRSCGEVGDFDAKNDQPINYALHFARKQGIVQALNTLNAAGYRDADIARVLGLRIEQPTDWRAGWYCGTTEAALLYVLVQNPKVLEQADLDITARGKT
jgi:hypothetical protein